MKGLKKILALIVSTLMILSLTACGNTATSTPSETTASTPEATASQSGTLRVLCWGATSDEQVVNDAVARFNEENPDVEVEATCVPVDDWNDFITKWSTMITSGEAPDVINYGLEAVQMAVSNNLLEPLDDIVAQDKRSDHRRYRTVPAGRFYN